jgi:hypothetical protein
MPEWKFVLDEQAFDFFRAARGAERQALIRAFGELRTHPTAEGVWQSRDDHGRDVEVGLFGKFLIHYWDDFLATELRIVRIARRE